MGEVWKSIGGYFWLCYGYVGFVWFMCLLMWWIFVVVCLLWIKCL